MSAVSNSVMPRSSARWITLREVSKSVRWPKLLQPSPTADTHRPEAPRLRISMGDPCRRWAGAYCDCGTPPQQAARRVAAMLTRNCGQRLPTKKCGPCQTRRLTGTALGRLIGDGGLTRRSCSLVPLCYARVTGKVIHRPRDREDSEDLAIDDEPGTFGDLVVQALRRDVGLMRLPIDARGACEFRALVDAVDQRRADTLAASSLGREQVLQI